jgi:Mn2+/Fe2+ NRAMP family transporter
MVSRRPSSCSEKPTGKHSSRKLQLEQATLSSVALIGTTVAGEDMWAGSFKRQHMVTNVGRCQSKGFAQDQNAGRLLVHHPVP